MHKRMVNSEVAKDYVTRVFALAFVCFIIGVPIYGVTSAVDKYSKGNPIPKNKIMNITIALTLMLILFSFISNAMISHNREVINKRLNV